MNKLVTSTFLYTIGNLLPQAVAFILLPIFTKYLSPAEYGVVNSMMVVQAFMAIFFTLALDRSIIRLFWDYNTEDNRKTFLGTISISIIAISVIFFLLSLLFRNYIQKFFAEIPFYPYYFFTVITAFCYNLSLLTKNLYRLKNNVAKYITLSAVELLATSGFTIWYIVYKEEMGLGVIKGKMIGFLALTPIYLIIILKYIKLKFKLEMLKNAMSFTLPIIPTLMAAWMLGQSDNIFIANYLSIEDVGIYSLSKRIVSIIGLIAGAFMLAYLPLYFEIANSDDQVTAKNKLFQYNNIFILAIIFVSFMLVFFSKEIIYLFLNERYYESIKYIPWMAVAILFGSVSSTILGASIQQSKKMKQDMFIGIFSAFINVSLNFLLIGHYKLNGMILSTVLSSFVIFLIAYYYTKIKCYYIPINWKYVSCAISGLVLLYVFFEYFIKLDVVILITLKLITLLVFFTIGFLFYKREIMSLLKK
jgi:O-antigen/teichoic acid export membrane protein